jgi:hypothetical protein
MLKKSSAQRVMLSSVKGMVGELDEGMGAIVFHPNVVRPIDFRLNDSASKRCPNLFFFELFTFTPFTELAVQLLIDVGLLQFTLQLSELDAALSGRQVRVSEQCG